jgi:hypothetical protein
MSTHDNEDFYPKHEQPLGTPEQRRIGVTALIGDGIPAYELRFNRASYEPIVLDDSGKPTLLSPDAKLHFQEDNPVLEVEPRADINDVSLYAAYLARGVNKAPVEFSLGKDQDNVKVTIPEDGPPTINGQPVEIPKPSRRERKAIVKSFDRVRFEDGRKPPSRKKKIAIGLAAGAVAKAYSKLDR